MNNNIKTKFSIKDLENLSGIKAHTIRIWEKRYNILQPTRTETNIRFYDSYNLQKLLNIVLLHKYGYKISKIATYDNSKINELVKEIASEKSKNNFVLNSFKVAMMNFDQNTFADTYNKLLSKKTFKEIFQEILIPLIEEIGLLWQTETITPAHEHFISHLIRQKIITNTDAFQNSQAESKNKVFVLFLPVNEIHELGLLYLNYELTSKGYQTIYLGQSVPTSSLQDVTNYFDEITFITYTTVEPSKDKINDYLDVFKNTLLTSNTNKLWMVGRMTSYIKNNTICKTFSSLNEILEEINS